MISLIVCYIIFLIINISKSLYTKYLINDDLFDLRERMEDLVEEVEDLIEDLSI